MRLLLNHKKKKTENKKTFTKKWIDRIFTVALIDIQFTYILAFLSVWLNFISGNPIDVESLVVTLAIAWVTEIVALGVAYFCKSYFETKAEREQLFEEHIYETERDERG